MNAHATPHGDMADTKLLRRAFGTFATGVTIVTVGGDTPHGMTANSFTSVSLDPPLALICVGLDSVMHSVLTDEGRFGVSVLASHQAKLASYFADRTRPLGREQFDSVDHLPGAHTGAPLIVDALSHFECEVRGTFEGGDHTIFLAEIISMDRCADDQALLFLNGRFRQIEPERSEVVT